MKCFIILVTTWAISEATSEKDIDFDKDYMSSNNFKLFLPYKTVYNIVNSKECSRNEGSYLKASKIDDARQALQELKDNVKSIKAKMPNEICQFNSTIDLYYNMLRVQNKLCSLIDGFCYDSDNSMVFWKNDSSYFENIIAYKTFDEWRVKISTVRLTILKSNDSDLLIKEKIGYGFKIIYIFYNDSICAEITTESLNQGSFNPIKAVQIISSTDNKSTTKYYMFIALLTSGIMNCFFVTAMLAYCKTRCMKKLRARKLRHETEPNSCVEDNVLYDEAKKEEDDYTEGNSLYSTAKSECEASSYMKDNVLYGNKHFFGKV